MPRAAIALLLVLASPAAPVAGHDSGPPTDTVRIPWPAEPLSDCSSCHDDRAANAFAGSVTLTGTPAEWQATQTYRLLVEVVDDTLQPRARWGFEAAAVDDALSQAGLLTRVNFETAVVADFGRALDFVRQNFNGSFQSTWEFEWTAPAAGAGDVTCYYCANAADGLGGKRGDHIFCASQTLAEERCDPKPGRIALLMAGRFGADVQWSWQVDADAAGGYRLYAVDRKTELPAANERTPSALVACPAPAPVDASCLEVDAFAAPGRFYQIVGVCASGEEGPN